MEQQLGHNRTGSEEGHGLGLDIEVRFHPPQHSEVAEAISRL